MIDTIENSLKDVIEPLEGELYRYAEDQERSVTRPLVGSLEEHDVLEEILEGAKPSYPANTEEYHYLLKTPFRYPPLPYGSRFGRKHERGILYASETYAALQMEMAFYRFSFYHDMEQPPAHIKTQHVFFAFDYHAFAGLNLADLDDDYTQHRLRHPSDYSLTQAIGSWAREQDIQALRYWSARTATPESNVAILEPLAITGPPRPMCNFTVYASEELVSVTTGSHIQSDFDRDIPLDALLVNGQLPRPAA